MVKYWDPLVFASSIEERLKCRLRTAQIDWKVDESHGPRHLHHMIHLFAVKGSPALVEPL